MRGQPERFGKRRHHVALAAGSGAIGMQPAQPFFGRTRLQGLHIAPAQG
jgi:hypothetical protein